MICDTCTDVFSRDIYQVPNHSSRTTKADLDFLLPLRRTFPEDGVIYFIAHKSSHQEIERSANARCRCCAWLLTQPQPLPPEPDGRNANVFGFWVLRQDLGIFNCIIDYRPRGCCLHKLDETVSDLTSLAYDTMKPRTLSNAFEIVAPHSK